nr:U32 family peptidase [Lachnospiraceae bacterium]
MRGNIPELLAPAGNFEILKKAAFAGADAVYFGGELFSARAYAGNLSPEEIISSIRFLHMRQKKAYLTVNTLLKSREIEGRLFSFLKTFYEEGLDAVLVQDMGVFSLVRDCFPDLPIHISTQCSVTSEYGARFFRSLGAERVVLSRELSIDEIKTIIKNCDIETEVFVHGALCFSYSGRCMMSSM